MALECGMVRLFLTVAICLAGCKDRPIVVWPVTQAGMRPDLLPLDQIIGSQAPSTDSRGAALAVQAAALRARAAQIGK